MTAVCNTEAAVMTDSTSSDAVSPVGGDTNGENMNAAQSEVHQQAETAPLLNVKALVDVLHDVPGENCAFGENNRH